MTRWLLIAVLSLCALVAAGCDTRFTALSVPPPGKIAELDDDDRRIEISRGVALAFECVSHYGDPCGGAKAGVEQPEVAEVFSGYLDVLTEAKLYGPEPKGGESRTIFVVVGRRAGQARLRVNSGDGNATFSVDVLAD
jgi:hypothetical protein